MDLFEQGQYQAAADQFKSILDKNSKIAQAYYGLGLVQAKISPGNNEQAIAHFEKAIKINRDYAMAYYQMALVYAQIPGEKKAL